MDIVSLRPPSPVGSSPSFGGALFSTLVSLKVRLRGRNERGRCELSLFVGLLVELWSVFLSE